MTAQSPLREEQEERLVRFLLGVAPPEEQTEIEDRALVEPDFYDDVMAAGDSLIHAYLKNSLPPEERARFEAHFLASPRRRERFDFVRGLVLAAQDASRTRARRRTVSGAWIAAAAVLILALLVGRRLWLGPSLDRQASVPPAKTPTSDPAPPRGAAGPHLVRLPAAAPDGPVEVALSDEVKTLRLEVPVVDDRYPTYDAMLRAADGARLWQATGVRPSDLGTRAAVILNVPARLLAAGLYALEVEPEPLRDSPAAAPAALKYRLRVSRPR